jgi:hypothetical protein
LVPAEPDPLPDPDSLPDPGALPELAPLPEPDPAVPEPLLTWDPEPDPEPPAGAGADPVPAAWPAADAAARPCDVVLAVTEVPDPDLPAARYPEDGPVGAVRSRLPDGWLPWATAGWEGAGVGATAPPATDALPDGPGGGRTRMDTVAVNMKITVPTERRATGSVLPAG